MGSGSDKESREAYKSSSESCNDSSESRAPSGPRGVTWSLDVESSMTPSSS